MYVVGTFDRITCSHDGAVIHWWEDEDENIVVNGGVLSIQTNDSIHHKTYSCYGATSTLQLLGYHMKFVINGKHIHVAVAIQSCRIVGFRSVHV